jgi:hypothetical protein
MTGTLLDLQWIIAADCGPGYAGRAKIVERDGLASWVVDRKQLRALDVRDGEAALQLPGAESDTSVDT